MAQKKLWVGDVRDEPNENNMISYLLHITLAGKKYDTSSKENSTPPTGAPNATATPAALAALSISLLLAVTKLLTNPCQAQHTYPRSAHTSQTIDSRCYPNTLQCGRMVPPCLCNNLSNRPKLAKREPSDLVQDQTPQTLKDQRLSSGEFVLPGNLS